MAAKYNRSKPHQNELYCSTKAEGRNYTSYEHCILQVITDNMCSLLSTLTSLFIDYFNCSYGLNVSIYIDINIITFTIQSKANLSLQAASLLS